MGEIFTSGKFVIFWYDCPITNKRKKKQVSISAKVSEAAAYAKAEKLQKELKERREKKKQLTYITENIR